MNVRTHTILPSTNAYCTRNARKMKVPFAALACGHSAARGTKQSLCGRDAFGVNPAPAAATSTPHWPHAHAQTRVSREWPRPRPRRGECGAFPAHRRRPRAGRVCAGWQARDPRGRRSCSAAGVRGLRSALDDHPESWTWRRAALVCAPQRCAFDHSRRGRSGGTADRSVCVLDSCVRARCGREARGTGPTHQFARRVLRDHVHLRMQAHAAPCLVRAALRNGKCHSCRCTFDVRIPRTGQ